MPLPGVSARPVRAYGGGKRRGENAVTQAVDFQPLGGPPGGEEEGEGPGVVARTPRQIFWAKFKQDKLALMGALLVILMILLALVAGIVE
ncbi:MAG: hypothetical protein GEU71_18375, partial [Actinobacteria bacterium]|nr:hypothetical protein [Actinomycetota bacterium]